MRSSYLYKSQSFLQPMASYLLIVLFGCLPVITFSQVPTLQASVNKKDILIGEQLVYTINATFPPNASVAGFQLKLPDSIPHFEIIQKGSIDTITYKDNSNAIQQDITFTSFDSGSWILPSFEVEFNKSTLASKMKMATDSIAINVFYSAPDSTNQLRDIKPVMEVGVVDYTWYLVAGAFVLLMLIVFLFWYYFKKRKQGPFKRSEDNISPYNEAMQELEKLAGFNLQAASEIKIFHTRLSDIFKKYLGRKENKNLSNSTTSDLLINLNNNSFAKDSIPLLANVLRCNDAVKFAKFLPSIDQSKEGIVNISTSINLIEQHYEKNKT